MVKIEDMTSAQRNGLRKEIADEVKYYLNGLQEIISRQFDCGVIDFFGFYRY